MLATHAIEIPLPEGASPTPDERTLLEDLCRTIVGLRFEREERWREVARQLELLGWDVHWRLAWIAEGRRRGCIEQGLGETLDEAFTELEQLTLLDQLEGCP